MMPARRMVRIRMQTCPWVGEKAEFCPVGSLSRGAAGMAKEGPELGLHQERGCESLSL